MHFELKTKFLAMMVLSLLIVPNPIRPFPPSGGSRGFVYEANSWLTREHEPIWGMWAAPQIGVQGQSQGEKPPEADGILAIVHQILH